MAENKDSTLELETELENMGDLDMDLGLNNDVSSDLVELKNRMDKADQEMRAMTEAMKSTLLDVRTLMQDMDNPFNMLRDMGVDKLVNVAVETVEDEVNKQKREEAKKRLAGGEEKDPVIVEVDGAAASNQGYPAMPGNVAPVGGVGGPAVTGQSAPSMVQPRVASPAPQAAQSAPSTQGSVEPATGGSADRTYIDEKMAKTEKAISEIAGTVTELAKVVKESNRRPIYQRQTQNQPRNFLESSDYYYAYVNLIADYLRIRLGESGSEEILLEGMYKEWASPKVVRDIMDKLSSIKRSSNIPTSSNSLGEVEDKMLITSLLRNLDKPVSEWGESTHLFLLLALVSRARESQGNRS